MDASPLRIFRFASKAIISRYFRRVYLREFLMSGMQDQPLRRWSDYLSNFNYRNALVAINWSNGGRVLSNDKVITTERFIDSGIEHVGSLAIVGRDHVSHPHRNLIPNLVACEDIVRFLQTAPDHLFIKPADGTYGLGIFAAKRVGHAWEVEDSAVSARQLANRLLAEAPPEGLLLQDHLVSHPGLGEIGGNLGLGTARVYTALTHEGGEVLLAIMKIMGSEGLIDNFAGGSTGNMLGAVDIDTGQITHVYGRRRGRTLVIDQITHHPVTAAHLVGFQIPLWDQVMELVKRAAVVCPEMPLIGFDVAILADGPRILETNVTWEAGAPQRIIGKGLRPILQELWPRLAAPELVKKESARMMGWKYAPKGYRSRLKGRLHGV